MGRGVGSQPGGDPRPKIRAGYRRSPTERSLLDYVAPRGIPRSEFLGAERTSVTNYHYDPDSGRLTHSVTVHQSAWTRRDREAAIEWATEQALLCDKCGRPSDETIGAERIEFDARPVRCSGCEALETAGRARAGIEEPNPSAGIKFQLSRSELPDGHVH